MLYEVITMFVHRFSRSILTNEVGRVIRWGYIVQKGGLPGLETDAKGLTRQDRFLGFAIDLVVSGYSGNEIREILKNTVETVITSYSIHYTKLYESSSGRPRRR